MANVSLTALRSDPLLSHNFVIQLIESSGTPSLGADVDLVGSLVGCFSECTGIEISVAVRCGVRPDCCVGMVFGFGREGFSCKKVLRPRRKDRGASRQANQRITFRESSPRRA